MHALDSLAEGWRLPVSVALGVGLAAALLWCFRGLARRRLQVSGFFLIAVVVHVLLGIGSFYVYLDTGAGAEIRREFRRMVVSTRTSLAGLRAMLKPTAEAFDQVADLKSAPTEDVSSEPSPGTAAPPVAAPSDLPAGLEPLPPRPARPAMVVASADFVPGFDARRLGRRRAPVAMAAETIALESLGAAAPAAEEQAEDVAVVVGRRPGGWASAGIAPGGGGSGASAALPGPPARGGVSGGGVLGGGAGPGDDEFGPLALAQLPGLKRAVRSAAAPVAEARAEIEGLGPAGAGSSVARAAAGGAGSGLLPGPGVDVEVGRRRGPAAPAAANLLAHAAPWGPAGLPPGLPGGARAATSATA